MPTKVVPTFRKAHPRAFASHHGTPRRLVELALHGEAGHRAEAIA